MYELTDDQFATIPFDSDVDNKIINRLIRIATTSKRLEYPQLWGESTIEKPVINLRQKARGSGIIVGGELSFYYRDLFITIGYDRDHNYDISQYKVTSADGKYYINQIWIGHSPMPNRRTRIARWRADTRCQEWANLMKRWYSLNSEQRQ